MTSLVAQPQSMAAAAADVAEIGSAIGQANAAAAAPTSGLVAAAADEISTAYAKLFSAYARDYQAVVKQASAFHQRFAQALAGAGISYAETEIANAAGGSLPGGTAATSGTVAATAVTPALAGQQIALMMGGSGWPIPSEFPGYITNLFNYYIKPQFANFSPQELYTPEGLYPLTGSKSLPLNESVAQGLTILNNALIGTAEGQHGLILPGNGNQVVVLGYSQSSVISSLEMQNLLNLPAGQAPNPGQLSFVLLGDPMNPNGGLFARFPGFPAGQQFQLPSMGLTFYGATTDQTPYATSIYTLQYDGYADFPKYPINILSDLNAFIGIETVHGTHPSIDPNNLPVGDKLVLLPGSTSMPGAGGEAALNTNYYMITQPDLPLLAPLRNIPVIGTPLADLLQPDLTAIVNLGYGDPAYGYSTSPANVQTTFGFLPHVSGSVIAHDLISGAQQGATAFVHDITGEAAGFSLSSVSHTLLGNLATLSTGNPFDNIIANLQTATTHFGNTISNVGATATALIQPTSDIANAIVTIGPAYDINLFLSGIQQVADGNLSGLVNAFGLPLAADTALLTLAGGFEALLVLVSAESIASQLTSLV